MGSFPSALTRLAREVQAMGLAERMRRGELTHGQAERLHLFVDLKGLGLAQRALSEIADGVCPVGGRALALPRAGGCRPAASSYVGFDATIRSPVAEVISVWSRPGMSLPSRWTASEPEPVAEIPPATSISPISPSASSVTTLAPVVRSSPPIETLPVAPP